MEWGGAVSAADDRCGVSFRRSALGRLLPDAVRVLVEWLTTTQCSPYCDGKAALLRISSGRGRQVDVCREYWGGSTGLGLFFPASPKVQLAQKLKTIYTSNAKVAAHIWYFTICS